MWIRVTHTRVRLWILIMTFRVLKESEKFLDHLRVCRLQLLKNYLFHGVI